MFRQSIIVKVSVILWTEPGAMKTEFSFSHTEARLFGKNKYWGRDENLIQASQVNALEAHTLFFLSVPNEYQLYIQ